MENKGISKSELARILKCSPAYITKVLNGSANLTIETLSTIAFALGVKWQCKTVPIDMDAAYEWSTEEKANPFGTDGLYKDIKCPMIHIRLEEYQKSA
jgi:transcriptional regulator with XRE-family HTH domain